MISIVIPTYNHLEDCLKPCIESIIKHTDLSNVEVIIVANGCNDGTKEYVQSLGNPFRLLWMKDAAGYTRSTNEGIRNARGEFVVLMNNDNVLLGQNRNEWLNILSKPFLENPLTGIAGVAKDFHNGTKSDFVLFFCVMLKMETIRKIGLLDESFNPGYGEDIDYCHKIRKLGMTVVQVPHDITLHERRAEHDHGIDFPIWHKGSVTVHHVDGWNEVVARNEKLLAMRYPPMEQIKSNSSIERVRTMYDSLKAVEAPCFEEIFDVNVYNLGHEIKDKTVIDIGACYGFFSLRCLELGAKRAICFEPQLDNFKQLCEFTKNFDSIKTFNAAIWDKSLPEVSISNDKLASNIFGESGAKVECRSLVDILSEVDSEEELILKLDCEGVEFDIIYNTPIEVLRRFSYIYAEIHDQINPNHKGKTKELLSYLSSIGFREEARGLQQGWWTFEGSFTPFPRINVKFKNDFVARKPKVEYSIVIPTYNHLEDCLKPCIESIKKHTDMNNVEVIVVANGCSDDTRAYVEGLGHPFRLIWIDEPAGYTRATNEGIKASVGKYVVLLNNDTAILASPTNAWLEMLRAPFLADPMTGITGAAKEMHPDTLIEFLLFFCVMIKRDILNRFGLMDEIFNPGYGEDIDYCNRVKLAGYKLVQVPYDITLSRPRELWEHQISFPIYHNGNQTVNDVSSWGSIVERNEKILQDRFGARRVPEYSIVIPTYNHLEDCLKPCIESIKKHTDLSNVEVIVVANGCNDATKEYVQSLGKPFKLIWLDNPAGYAKATNKGIEEAIGRYVVLLNNDTVVLDPSWLAILQEPFLRDSKMGITGPHMERVDGTNVDYLMFFCVMIRREALVAGLLDESFGVGTYEDADYCERVIRAGYKLQQVPNAQLSKETYSSNDEKHADRIGTFRGQFPIYHAGGKTVKDIAGFGEIAKANLSRFMSKYGIAKDETNMKLNFLKRILTGTVTDEVYQNFISTQRYPSLEVMTRCIESPIEHGIQDGSALPGEKAFTMIGMKRLDNLHQMLDHVRINNVEGDIIETGVWRGGACIFIKAYMNMYGMKRRLFVADSFMGCPPPSLSSYNEDRNDDHHTRPYLSVSLDDVKANFRKFGLLDNYVIFMQGWFAETLKTDQIQKLSLLRFDGDMYCSTMDVLNNLYHKLSHNAPIIIDDYGLQNCKIAVDTFRKDNNIQGNMIRIDTYGVYWLVSSREPKKHKIYDCFPFFNELDILELRLNELNDVVDHFVLVEATLTHSGKPKPLYFKDNKHRFEKFLPKIIHKVVDNFPPNYSNDPRDSRNSWTKEMFQRDSVMEVLTRCSDDDIILFSDVDEIPRPSVLRDYDPSAGITYLSYDMHYYFLNCYGTKEKWNHAKIGPYREMKKILPSQLRYSDRDGKMPGIKNAGWHFSFLGGVEKVIEKVNAYCHQELNEDKFTNREHVIQSIMNGKDLFGRDIPYKFVEINESYPSYVLNNLDKYKKLGFIRDLAENKRKVKYSIVIPTYNHLEDCLKPCIESIIKNTDLSNVEVIIVANGCNDGTKEYVESLGDPFRLVWMKDAAGYARATNAGIKASNGEYVVLLNNDTVLLNNSWLPLLEQPFIGNDDVGITGPVKYDVAPFKVYHIVFFCVMIRRKVFETIGLLDETFEIGSFEDIDFSVRTGLSGFRLEQVPDTKQVQQANQNLSTGNFPIYHVGGQTVSGIANYYGGITHKNFLQFMEKYAYLNIDSNYEQRVQEKNDISEHLPVLVEYAKGCKHITEMGTRCCNSTWAFMKARPEKLVAYDIFKYEQVDTVEKSARLWGIDFEFKKENVLQCQIEPTDLLFIDTVHNYDQLSSELKIHAGNVRKYIILHDTETFADVGDYAEPKYNVFDSVLIKGKGLGKAIEEFLAREPSWKVARKITTCNGLTVLEKMPSPAARKVYDCFIFFNELDLLELRLNELNDVVDHFVIVEATETFAGNPKQLFFDSNRDRFQKFFSKIIHVVVDEFPSGLSPREKEAYQRNHILEGLQGCSDDDVVLISDIDEIPNKKAILSYDSKQGISNLGQSLYYYFINCKTNETWYQPKILSFNQAKTMTPDNIRNYHIINQIPTINNGGWHFSYLGGVNGVIDKIKAFSHQELNTQRIVDPNHVAASINNAEDIYNRPNTKFNIVDVDDSFPDWVLNHLDHFRKIGFIKETNKIGKVYDCFSFFNELDLLEVRMNELDSYVDYFVIAEANVTHSGMPKPLYFNDNKDRYKKFLHKTIHIVVNDCPVSNDPWIREHFQRNAIQRGLTNCNDNDVIIVSDIDEIPRGKSISQYQGQRDIMFFEQREYNYYMNLDVGVPDLKTGVFSRITTYGHLKKFGCRCTDIRYQPCTELDKIPNGGWHFSWLGGAKQIVNKLESWAHQELNIEQYKDVDAIVSNIENGMDAFGRFARKGKGFVEIDDSFPEFVRQNTDALIAKNLIRAFQPKIAIVMPYYNDKELFVRSVMGVLGQTFQNWVLYIVDDGSDDKNRAEDVLGFRTNSRIRVLRKANGGPSSARNLALHEIRKLPFTHVAYCDADDIWSERYLEEQIAAIGDADLIYCKADNRFLDGSKAIPFGIPDPDEYPGLEYMIENAFIYISGVVHKAKCLSVGDFDSSLDSIEDWDMWVRIAKAGYKIKKNKSTYITYIVKTSNNMASKRTEQTYALFREKHSFAKQEVEALT